MENTRATIRTRCEALGLELCGALLFFCAMVNLFGTFSTSSNQNNYIVEHLKSAADLPDNQKQPELSQLLHLQEKALSAKPSAPYGWARLSYLRAMTGQGDQEAFAALRMSDLVSPYEVAQLPERAVSWIKFNNVETLSEKEYQYTLWQKAYTVTPDATWDTALQYGLTKYVAAVLARKNKDLGDGWRDRMVAAGMMK